MKVDIQSVELDLAINMFRVVKRITGDGQPELNVHLVPVQAVQNYALFYSLTEEQALDFILFEPFQTPGDAAETVADKVNKIKIRVQAGDGLANCHQIILTEVRKHAAVSETNLDSPCGRSGSPRKPGASQQGRVHDGRAPNGGLSPSGPVRDTPGSDKPAAAGQAPGAGGGPGAGSVPKDHNDAVK